MNSDPRTDESHDLATGEVSTPEESGPQQTPLARKGNDDLDPDAKPHMASIQTLWSRPVRLLVVVLLVGAAVAYTLFGTILARNVTFNMSQNIDPGRSNGIRRFSRESIIDVWQTMWAKAPDFGTIDLTRGILLVSTVAFFVAFALVITLIFVPSRREWATDLSDEPASDTIAGD